MHITNLVLSLVLNPAFAAVGSRCNPHGTLFTGTTYGVCIDQPSSRRTEARIRRVTVRTILPMCGAVTTTFAMVAPVSACGRAIPAPLEGLMSLVSESTVLGC